MDTVICFFIFVAMHAYCQHYDCSNTVLKVLRFTSACSPVPMIPVYLDIRILAIRMYVCVHVCVATCVYNIRYVSPSGHSEILNAADPKYNIATFC